MPGSEAVIDGLTGFLVDEGDVRYEEVIERLFEPYLIVSRATANVVWQSISLDHHLAALNGSLTRFISIRAALVELDCCNWWSNYGLEIAFLEQDLPWSIAHFSFRYDSSQAPLKSRNSTT